MEGGRDVEVILIRHGITQGNKEKRFVGRLDVPLAPEGEEMARETAPLLPEVEHLYVSPMRRCRETADGKKEMQLDENTDKTISPDPRIYDPDSGQRGSGRGEG